MSDSSRGVLWRYLPYAGGTVAALAYIFFERSRRRQDTEKLVQLQQQLAAMKQPEVAPAPPPPPVASPDRPPQPTAAPVPAPARAPQRVEGSSRSKLQLPPRQDSGATALASVQEALSDSSLTPALRRAHIDPKNVKLGRTLGRGTVGEVREGMLHGTPVAVKRLHRHMLTRASLAAFKAECEMSISLRHPNIVQLLGGSWDLGAANVMMIMESCGGGTLTSALLDDAQPMPWMSVRLPILVGVARALQYLHIQTPQILHRDLKSDNVLLTSSYEPKVCDFGSSRELTASFARSVVGTPLTTAPEVLLGEGYRDKADVWSYGCLIITVYRRTSFAYRNEELSDIGLHNLSTKMRSGELRPHFFGDGADEADEADEANEANEAQAAAVGQLARLCCAIAPDERPHIADVLADVQAAAQPQKPGRR